MKKRISIFTLSSIICLISYTNTFPVEISLSINRTLMYLTGDVYQLKIIVNHNSDEEIVSSKSDISLNEKDFYKKILNAPHPIEKIDIESVKPRTHTINKSNGNYKITETFLYTFQIFEIENLQVGPVKFLINYKNREYVVYSPYTYINIIPPYSKTNLNSPLIQDVDPEKKSSSNYYKLLLILVILIILLSIILFLSIKRIYRWYILKQDKLNNPYIQAKVSFQSIQEMNNISDGMTTSNNETYHQLSRIMKHYLERRFHISLIEKNTAELYDLLYPLSIDPIIQLDIIKYFQRCDEMKFLPNYLKNTHLIIDIQLALKIINTLNLST